MIQLADNILPFLLKFSREELLVYLLINRYLTEDQPVPLDHIQELTGLIDSELLHVLKSLTDQSVLELELDQSVELEDESLSAENLVLRDPINEKIGCVNLTTELETQFLAFIYNNIIKKNKLTTNSTKLVPSKKEKKSTAREPVSRRNQSANPGQDSLSPQQESVTSTFRKVLNHLHDKAIKVQANSLVDHFADTMLKLYEDIQLTPKWRTLQFSIAKRLFKSYDYPLETWKAAVGFFAGQEYWADKLSSLKQVETNIHQFLGKKEKKSKASVRTIK